MRVSTHKLKYAYSCTGTSRYFRTVFAEQSQLLGLCPLPKLFWQSSRELSRPQDWLGGFPVTAGNLHDFSVRALGVKKTEQVWSGQLQVYSFFYSGKCTCTDSSTDSSTAPYFVPVAWRGSAYFTTLRARRDRLLQHAWIRAKCMLE